MLSQNLVTIIENRVKQDLEDRCIFFERELAQIKENMVAKGSLYSGATVRSILNAISNEYRIRTSMIWQAFARALTSKGIALGDNISSEVKERLSQMLDANSGDLSKSYQELTGIMHGSKPKESIQKLRIAALERIYNEIDYASLGCAQSSDSHSTVNIYQSCGIVQTGLGSSASLSINLSPEERHEVEKVIESVRQLIEQSNLINSNQKGQAKELISDLEGEIQRSQPNTHRIRGALQGLATTVQTLAAAPQVYQLIKGAAALFGMQLP